MRRADLKMKRIMKNIKIIALFIGALTLYSCSSDFLSPAPKSAIGGDDYFSNEQELETGVINMYDGIQGMNFSTQGSNTYNSIQLEYQLTEMRSDNTRTKGSEGEPAEFESFSVQSTNGVVANYYMSMYNVVFRANLVLANLDVASSAAATRFEGEAKFVRAYAYFNLVRLYGDIPMATEVITPTNEDVAFTRVATSEVYNLIISDLTTAIANLDNGSKTRASQAAAQAMLAKVHLTLGNYTEAQDLCEDVMAGGFSLMPNFHDVFYSERNDEIIFAIGYLGDNDNDSQNFSAEMTHLGRSSGLNYLTNEMINAFTAYGGAERTGLSYRPDPVRTDGAMQVQKFVSDGFTFNDGTSDITVGSTSSDLTKAGNDWIVLRYADVLLMHVEAIMGAAPSTSDATALTSFQAVRDRAGLTTPVSTITRNDLLNERRVELAFENHRLFDLIRMGVAETVLGDFATANGYSFSATDLLLPIPQREIGLSKGLMSQNPGY